MNFRVAQQEQLCVLCVFSSFLPLPALHIFAQFPLALALSLFSWDRRQLYSTTTVHVTAVQEAVLKMNWQLDRWDGNQGDKNLLVTNGKELFFKLNTVAKMGKKKLSGFLLNFFYYIITNYLYLQR